MKKPKPIRAFRCIAADCCAPAKPTGNCYPCAVLDVGNPKKLTEQLATFLNDRINEYVGTDYPMTDPLIGAAMRDDANAILANLGILRRRKKQTK